MNPVQQLKSIQRQNEVGRPTPTLARLRRPPRRHQRPTQVQSQKFVQRLNPVQPPESNDPTPHWSSRSHIPNGSPGGVPAARPSTSWPAAPRPNSQPAAASTPRGWPSPKPPATPAASTARSASPRPPTKP